MSSWCSSTLKESIDMPLVTTLFHLWRRYVEYCSSLAVEKCFSDNPGQHPVAAAVSHRQIFKIIGFFWGFVSHWWSFLFIGGSFWDRKAWSRMTTRLPVRISFAFGLSSISNCGFRCFLRHKPLRSAKLVQELRAGEDVLQTIKNLFNLWIETDNQRSYIRPSRVLFKGHFNSESIQCALQLVSPF